MIMNVINLTIIPLQPPSKLQKLQKVQTLSCHRIMLWHLKSGRHGSLSLLTNFLLFIELCLWEFHIKCDNEGTSDVIVVKVWQALAFLPHPGSRLGDLISHNMDLPCKNTTANMKMNYHSLSL